jgi:hypothetical protein
MAFTFSTLNKEYRNAVLTMMDVIYDVVLTYFIHKSPKQIVAELNQDKYFDHNELIAKMVDIVNKNKINYPLSMFSETPTHVITQLYYCIFGQNGDNLNAFIYLKKGKGWCERYFPPSDHEMYTFIVDSITSETKRQFNNPIKL